MLSSKKKVTWWGLSEHFRLHVKSEKKTEFMIKVREKLKHYLP